MSVFGDSPYAIQSRMDAIIERFDDGLTTVQPSGFVVDTLPSEPMDMVSNAEASSWAAVGRDPDERAWVIRDAGPLSTWSDLAGDLTVHLAGRHTVVIAASPDITTLLIIDEVGGQHSFGIRGRASATAVTPARIILALEDWPESRFVAFDFSGNLTFDYLRDMTILQGGIRHIPDGVPLEDILLMSPVAESTVAVVVDDPSVLQFVDLIDRRIRVVELPGILHGAAALALASDGSMLASVIPGELWYVHGFGPILRVEVSATAQPRALLGGAMLMWDRTGGAVFAMGDIRPGPT